MVIGTIIINVAEQVQVSAEDQGNKIYHTQEPH